MRFVKFDKKRLRFIVFSFSCFAILVIIYGCSLSPGRKVIAKGVWESEVAVNGLIGDPVEGFAFVPNLNLGMRYGITDRLNIGMSIDPLILSVRGITMVEPYIVVSLIKQKYWFPSLNIHSSFPSLIAPKSRDLRIFPEIGLTPNYIYKRWSWYSTFSLSMDSKTYSNGIDPHYSLCIGTAYQMNDRLALAFESGLGNIGRPSILTNASYGQPAIAFGVNYCFVKKENQKK
jgi:hypothetical protein